MIEGIYVAASAGFKQEKSLEVISNNLANVNTVGYKRDTMAFEEILAPFSNSTQKNFSTGISGEQGLRKDASYTGIAGFKSDLSQGGIVETGNPLDVALDGEGFFAIETQEGIRYTRQGNFSLNSKGILVTHDGKPVLGDGGPITIKGEGNTISIDNAGKIYIGNGLSNSSVGNLKIVSFEEPEKLMKAGNGLFMITGDTAGETKAKNVSVKQGAIESSNVTAVKEMTKMIEVMRSYQSYQQVIKTIDEANAKAATELGRFA